MRLSDFLPSHSRGSANISRGPIQPATISAPLAVAFGVVTLLGASYPLVEFARVVAASIAYPFDLEWMEGGMITHVQVVLAGEQLYRKPSIEFTPFIYAPLYYYVSALFALVFGVGHFALRLVSVLSIVGCFVLIAVWVHKETRDWMAGFVAAGMFSATYAVSEFWFDLARVDSLFLALTLGGYVLARFADTRRRAVAAGLLLAAAALTKQVGLLLMGPPLLYLVLKSRRSGLVASAATIGTLGVAVTVFNLTSGGWFWFYVFDLPSQHAVAWENAHGVLGSYFWSPVALLALSGLAVSCGVGFRRESILEWALVAVFVVCCCFASLSGMLHTGGYPNTLFPAYAALSVAFGLVFARLRRARGAFLLGDAGARLIGLAAVLLQVGLLSYEREKAVPTGEDRALTQTMIRELSALPQPMWVTASSYYPFVAGQRERVTHAMGLVDVLKGDAETANRLRRSHARGIG